MMPRYSLISSNFIRLLRDVILEINKERNRCCPVVAGGFGRLWRRRAYYVRRLCCFLPLALILFICIDVGTKDGCSGLLGPNLEQPGLYNGFAWINAATTKAIKGFSCIGDRQY